MSARSRSARRALTAIDRAGVWIIGLGAALVATLHVVGLAASGREILGSGPLTVRNLALGNSGTPQFATSSPEITGASYETATVTVAQAPTSARWLLWGEVAATSLAAVGIALALAWLCVRVIRYRPFGRSVTLALFTTAVLVMVGGVLTDVLGAMGRAELVSALGTSVLSGDHGEGLLTMAMNVSLAPIGIGLAIGVLGAAFEVGARLQRDTEGLI